MDNFEIGIAQAIALLGNAYRMEAENGRYYMEEILPEVKGEKEMLKHQYDELLDRYRNLERKHHELTHKYNDVRDGLLKLMSRGEE